MIKIALYLGRVYEYELKTTPFSLELFSLVCWLITTSSGTFLRVPPVALKMQPHTVLGFSNKLSTYLTIFKLVNVFISDTTIWYPTCHLCSKFVISTVKSRQTSNIHTHGFLLKYKKKHLILPTDQSKSPKKR